MGRNTTEREIVESFLSQANPAGRWIRTIVRADEGCRPGIDGQVEQTIVPNVVLADGLNNLASRAIADTDSKYNWIAIGSSTHTPDINSQFIAESDRKAGAIVNSSKEVLFLIATWGGDADGVTSVSLTSGAIANHQTSGSGHYLNHASGLSTVLGDSDFLHLEVQVQIGSHNI